MRIHDKLDEVVAFVESARGLPMSSSVVVNKAELERLLEELRGLLPDDLLEAQAVLERREQILTEAVANAERLLTAAEEEKRRLVAEEEVLRQARIEAGTVLQSARAESEHMAREIDGYVDAKLAHLEVSITKLLDTVRQGRDHLAEPGLYNDLAAPDEPEPPVPTALEVSYDRPELDSRPAFVGGEQGQAGQYPDDRDGWADGQPEQPGHPPGPTGFEAYEVPSGYRAEPYPEDAYQVDPPAREPDPLTDDVWLTPAMPRGDDEPYELAGAAEPETEFETNGEAAADDQVESGDAEPYGESVPDDVQDEVDDAPTSEPDAPAPDEGSSPDEAASADDEHSSTEVHDAPSSADRPAEGPTDSPGDSPVGTGEPAEPVVTEAAEAAETEETRETRETEATDKAAAEATDEPTAEPTDETAPDEEPVEARPLNRG